jgi:hypothetical protein
MNKINISMLVLTLVLPILIIVFRLQVLVVVLLREKLVKVIHRVSARFERSSLGSLGALARSSPPIFKKSL